jgi:hypothetical protein
LVGGLALLVAAFVPAWRAMGPPGAPPIAARCRVESLDQPIAGEAEGDDLCRAFN